MVDFLLKEHHDKFETIKNSGWFDPLTREENFICSIITYYGQTVPNYDALKYILESVPITNRVFECLQKIETNRTVITEAISKLSMLRREELNLMYKLI